MKFLVEKRLKSKSNASSLLDAKDILERENNIKYRDLTKFERMDFIQSCIDIMPNAKLLNNLRKPIVSAVLDSNFGDSNKKVLKYFDELNNPKVTEDIATLVSTLILRDSIDYTKSKKWLNNQSLYNRSEEDILYAIKALTLADNPTLQNKNGQNIFGDKPLSIRNFMKNGEIFPSSKIKDILNKKQVVKVDNKSSTKDSQDETRYELKKKAKENGMDETKVDTRLDAANEVIKDELTQVLQSLGIKNPTSIISQNFEEGKTTEFLLSKILGNM